MAWDSWWNWWRKDKHERSIADFGVWLYRNYRIEAYQLKDYWWKLSVHHKARIADKVIEHYTRYLGLSTFRSNKEDEWQQAVCIGHSLIRCCMLGNLLKYAPVLKEAEYMAYGKVKSWAPDKPLGLPVYYVQVSPGHAICGFYLGAFWGGWDDVRNWRFFQYSEFDIPLDGSSGQIGKNQTVSVVDQRNPDVKITSRTLAYYGSDVEKFYLATFKT
jgi:hypothetical protein